MTNKKIASEVAIGIVLLLAIAIGGIFWMQSKKAELSKKQISATQPVQEAQPQQLQDQQKTADNSEKEIANLSEKWSQAGLMEWTKKEILGSEVIGILPVDTKNFKISTNKDSSLHYAELGTLLGSISSKYASDDKLFGDATVSTASISDNLSLEAWINATGTTIHQNYCKKYGTDDLRYPDNKTCITKISIVKKINDNIIEWNPEFVGSPDILSVLVGNTIVTFEMSQDLSQGKVDFRTFLQDIALTLEPMESAAITED